MPKLTTGLVTRPDKNPKMAANAWGKMRSELAKPIPQGGLGYSQAWINATIGSNLGGRDKAEVMELIRAGLNTPEAAAKREERRRA